MSTPSRPRTAALGGLLVVVALLAAGCGGLPVSAAVRVARTIGAAQQAVAQDIRVHPPGPQTGQDPAEVVQAFLNAASDDDDDYDIARLFLAPGVVWDTHSKLTVYSTETAVQGSTNRLPRAEGGVTAPRASSTTAPGSATVIASLALVASLDAAGNYTPLAGTGTGVFTVKETDKQWRITGLPAGVMLSLTDLERSYQPSVLWWFSPDYTYLVPQQVWLPDSPDARQTLLADALLVGPDAALAPGVISAVPPRTQLAGSVTLTAGGDVIVDLNQAAASLLVPAAKHLLAQLSQTLLSQVPLAVGLRLAVNGEPLPLQGVPQRVTIGVASAADPDLSVPDRAAFALVNGRVTSVATTGTTAAVSAPATATLATLGPLLSVAVAPGSGAVAVLVPAPGGLALPVEVSPVGGERTLAAPGHYIALSWSATGSLLLATPTSLLFLSAHASADASGAATAMTIGAGMARPIDSIAFARDGVRVLIVAGPPSSRSVYLGTLRQSTRAATLSGLSALTPGLSDVTSAGWASASQIDAIGATAGSPYALWQMSVDGSQLLQAATLPSSARGPITLAVAPGSVPLITSEGQVDGFEGGSWHLLLRARAANYPG